MAARIRRKRLEVSFNENRFSFPSAVLQVLFTFLAGNKHESHPLSSTPTHAASALLSLGAGRATWAAAMGPALAQGPGGGVDHGGA